MSHDKFDLVVAHLMSHIAIGDVATPTAPLARSLTAHNAAPHLHKIYESAGHSLFLVKTDQMHWARVVLCDVGGR